MRQKLALTIALAGFAVVTALGVGMAGADPSAGLGDSQAAKRRAHHPRLALDRNPGLRERSRRRRRRPRRPRRPRLRIGLRHERGTASAGAGQTRSSREAAARRQGSRPARASTPPKPPAAAAAECSATRASAPRTRPAAAGSAPERDRRRSAPGRRLRRRLGVRQRRRPYQRQPDGDLRPVRPGPGRRPQLRHRLLRDPALPAADLPGLRHRVRHPLGGARLDQQNRDQLRHQHGAVHRRRARLDAVHARELGGIRPRRQRRRPQGPLQPGRRDLRRCPLPQGGGRQRRPLQRDLRLQPRRLVRAGGAALRARLRQAADASSSAR